MTDYQRGILIALGTYSEGRFIIRNIDRWYCDIVQDVFKTKVYSIDTCIERDGVPQWCIKSTFINRPDVSEIENFADFCRAYLEIHGALDMRPCKNRRGEKIRKLRLRIYGKEEILSYIDANFRFAEKKKIQHIATQTGSTCALYYQSPIKILDIMRLIDGEPKNPTIWAKWNEVLAEVE